MLHWHFESNNWLKIAAAMVPICSSEEPIQNVSQRDNSSNEPQCQSGNPMVLFFTWCLACVTLTTTWKSRYIALFSYQNHFLEEISIRNFQQFVFTPCQESGKTSSHRGAYTRMIGLTSSEITLIGDILMVVNEKVSSLILHLLLISTAFPN